MENAKEPERRTFSRGTAIAAVVTLLAAALASVWGFLAAQSPSSPLHLGPLAGPVDSLARACWIAGTLGLALGAALPGMRLPPALERRAVRFLIAGWAILGASMLAGAALGTAGTQVIQAYPKTVAVILGKLAGFSALLAGLVTLLRAVAGRRG